MKQDDTRRDLLKLAGTATVFGFTNNATAKERPSGPHGHEVPDLRVRNGDQRSHSLSVTLYEATEDGQKKSDRPAFATDYELSLNGTEAAVDTASLDVPGGKYVVEVELTDGTTESTVWSVLPTGVPSWAGFLVRIRPGAHLDIASVEV